MDTLANVLLGVAVLALAVGFSVSLIVDARCRRRESAARILEHTARTDLLTLQAGELRDRMRGPEL